LAVLNGFGRHSSELSAADGIEATKTEIIGQP